MNNIMRYPWQQERASDSGEKGIPRDGFSAHANWIAQDPDSETLIYRKFDKLSARNLLFLQSRLASLETKLDKYDEEIRQIGDMDSKLSQIRWETFEKKATIPGRPEQKLLELHLEIQKMLREYHETLMLQSSIASLERPSNRALTALRNWTSGKGFSSNGNDRPIFSGKDQFMYDDVDDLVALRTPTDKDILSKFLQDHWKPFGKSQKHSTGDVAYFLERHVIHTVAVISTIIAAILLVGAITVLYFITNPGARLGTIACFMVLFALSISLMTNAKRAEIFAATAAYAAVLVVFVSGDLGGSGGKDHI